ncbi:asparaginase [Actinoplanes hulinensis]|uniref:Asparaginase n=1 Tax=Actinoplanes hulinensis TaxID=1144547 RepID=A0ABS7B3M1_9ACTN|nr:asparaginase [Actinoplanes hulinensis]
MRIVVAGLGGTIAMTGHRDGGVAPTLSAPELVEAVPGLSETGIELDVRSFRNRPGAALTLGDLGELLSLLRESFAAGAAGAVVTQGTDTIEETAYALSLLHTGDEPSPPAQPSGPPPHRAGRVARRTRPGHPLHGHPRRRRQPAPAARRTLRRAGDRRARGRARARVVGAPPGSGRPPHPRGPGLPHRRRPRRDQHLRLPRRGTRPDRPWADPGRVPRPVQGPASPPDPAHRWPSRHPGGLHSLVAVLVVVFESQLGDLAVLEGEPVVNAVVPVLLPGKGGPVAVEAALGVDGAQDEVGVGPVHLLICAADPDALGGGDPAVRGNVEQALVRVDDGDIRVVRGLQRCRSTTGSGGVDLAGRRGRLDRHADPQLPEAGGTEHRRRGRAGSLRRFR